MQQTSMALYLPLGTPSTVNTLVLFAVGVVVGVAGVLLFRLRPGSEKRLYGIGLIIAALIYVGFALHGDGAKWIGIELLGLLVYGIAAIAGWRGSGWWLAIGWAAHAAWDLVVHGAHTPFAPRPYAVWCAGVDITFGVYLAWRLRSARSI
jgi:hypothetical protein